MATHHFPPRTPTRLLEWTLPRGVASDGLVGDLYELYAKRRDERGRLSADLWYWREACSAALRYRLAGHAEKGAPHQLKPGRNMDGVWTQVGSEIRQSARRLVRSPGFTLAATVPLALGLGAVATIFTLVGDVVLTPLPYPDPDRLVVIRNTLPGYEIDGRLPRVGAFMGQYLHYRERSALLAELGGYWTFDAPLTSAEGAEYVHFGGATAGLWRALGIRPVEGRFVREDDPWPTGDGQGVTLLSHGYSAAHYGNVSAVGRSVRAQGSTFQIVGVLPGPLPLAPTRPAMWNAIPEAQARANPNWTMPALVGRLAPGASPEALQRELAALIAELPERYPDVDVIRNSVQRGRMAPEVLTLTEWVLGGIGRTLWLLFTSVLLLLLVAVANVAGLSLVRADNARRELAVRVALGSGWRGLVLRMLMENILVIGVATLLGLALARVGVAAMIRNVPTEIPRIDTVAFGWAKATFLLSLAVVSMGVLAGVQLLHCRRNLLGALRDAGRGAVVGSTRLRLRHAFVGFQIALAVVLAIGAGLIVRSASGLGRTDPGFEMEGLLTFRVPFPFGEIQAAGKLGATATPFFEELTRRLEALPGVDGAGWGSCAPLSRFCDSGGFAIRRADTSAEGEDPAASFVQVSQAYRAALGIPLIEGRDLTADDYRRLTNRVLVSESLARRLWPGESALERTFTPVTTGWTANPKPFTVSGVVGDVRFDNLRRDAGSMVYAPALIQDQPTDVSMATFVLRTSVPPAALLAGVRRTVTELRADIPLAFAESMETSLAHETAGIRFSSLLVMLAAVATLLLSVLGVYGVLAYVVGLRRAEFGIRLAMGASGAQLRRMVLAQGMTTAAAGAVLGILAAATASRLARSVLFGVEPIDPPTYALAAAILLIAAAGATWLPAQRASRVHPADALRGG